MDQEKLAAALESQDSNAIHELVETHANRLLRSAFLFCGNENDAQDLVQDTFVQALKSFHRFERRSAIYTWLHAILLNLSRHYHRDRKRLIFDSDLAEREMEAEEQVLTHLDETIAAGQLGKALRMLSEAHREVLILRYFEQWKIEQIARHLRISKGTVKSRLHYALAEMQKLLPGELNLYGAAGTKERT